VLEIVPWIVAVLALFGMLAIRRRRLPGEVVPGHDAVWLFDSAKNRYAFCMVVRDDKPIRALEIRAC
jgi:hypothetical protein